MAKRGVADLGSMERTIGKEGSYTAQNQSKDRATATKATPPTAAKPTMAAKPSSASSSAVGHLGEEVIPSLEPLEALQDAGIPILLVGGTGIPQCTFPVLAEVLGEQTAYYLTKSLLEAGMGERLDPTYAAAMDTLEFNKLCEDLFGPEPAPKKAKKFPLRRR
jgi:hypothetical protein